MKRAVKITYTAVIIFILAALILFPFQSFGTRIARAEASGVLYSDVMDDLRKDENFDVSDYPFKSKDYSLKVIQIAESVNGELFIYVYQPAAGAKGTTATSINISTAINENLSYKNYELKLLNHTGVFFKYLVTGFEVLPDALRYYDISGIYRAWNSEIDKDTDKINENEISEVVYGIEKRYTACTVGGEVSYRCQQPEYVVIADKYVGYLRYKYTDVLDIYSWVTAGAFNVDATLDCWFVAFSCNRDIDTLLEADVYYVSQTYVQTALIINLNGPKKKNYVNLTYKDSRDVETGGLFWDKKYTWDRIQSTEDFIAREDLTDTGKANVSGKQWVLRFTETEYMNSYAFIEEISYEKAGTRISDVTILRLKFETDGIVYNLGVIDNKQSPADGQAPSNNVPKSFWEKFIEFWENVWNFIKNLKWWHWLLLGLGLIIAVVLVVLIIKWGIVTVFKGIFWLIKKLLQGLWWLLTLPFRLIANAIKNRKKTKKD